MSFAACIQFTLQAEGRFVDNPQDPGGATNMGITLATFREYTNQPDATVAELRALTDAEASAIYRTNYWNVVRGDELPAGVDLMVFDFGVNAGPGRSIQLLQRAVGCTADGIIGPVTLGKAKAVDPIDLIGQLAAAQKTYYQGLGGFDIFGDGWLARLGRRQTLALSLAQGSESAGASS